MKAVKLKLMNALKQSDKVYPGDPADRQPVHTVYGGAQLFSRETIKKLGSGALAAFEQYAPSASVLQSAVGGQGDFWETVYHRVRAKLQKEAVEDFRIDFEDGYGTRSDEEEDAHAKSAALELLASFQSSHSPFCGIRIKSFSRGTYDRAVRTLEVFLKHALPLPPQFVVTLPKVTHVSQISAFVKVLQHLEKKYKIKKPISFEFMVETTQSILDSKGVVPLAQFVKAGLGRCSGAHFGTYDYTASHNIVAVHQQMLHPACDFAKQMMKVALSQTGVFLSDGATNVMPVPIHRGEKLSPKEREENLLSVHRAWKMSFEAITHSLRTGFYQGWDLHPAQIPIRYAAVYAFFLSSLETSTARLKGFVEKAARATLLGDVFDDAATGQGLLNFFLRGRSCGALLEGEVTATGLTTAELESRSFAEILRMRVPLQDR